MAAQPEDGFLVIADITGYTQYLAGSELEHAPRIAGNLLETVVSSLDPPYRLAKFEGDAAFLYVEDGQAEAPVLYQAIEACYVAFRRRLRSIEQATACACNSCGLAPNLDLKLFVHHGRYVRTAIAGREELAGSDIILVHRLLKGTAAAYGGSGFALFTAGAVEALRLEPAKLGLIAAEDRIEHFGSIITFTLDLDARWRSESEMRRIEPAGGTIFDLLTTIDAEPELVWAHLTSPSLRAQWEGSPATQETAPGGAWEPGPAGQCVTDRLETLDDIVDWQPWEHVGWRFTEPTLGPVVATADLVPVNGRTRLRLRWASQDGTRQEDGAAARVRAERKAGLARLATVIAESSRTR